MAVEADESAAANEGNGVGNLSSGDDAVLRIGFGHLCPRRFWGERLVLDQSGDGAVGHFAFDETRADRHNHDAMLGVFQCQAFGQTDKSVLAGTVGGIVFHALEAGRAGDDADVAALALDHAGQTRLGEPEGAVDIDCENFFPQVFVEAVTDATLADSGVADKILHCPLVGQHLCHGGVGSGGVGDVAYDIVGTATSLANFFAERRQFRFGAADSQNRSFFGHTQRHHAANAAAGAGDDSN